jgi:gliding motility-associated-like protein
MPKIQLLLWKFSLLLLIWSSPLAATHIIGGEIFYDCLGNNRFRITLKVYRDCLNGQAPFDDPLTVSVFDASGRLVRNIEMIYPGSRFVPLQNLNPCYQDNARVCVEEAVYSQEEILPFKEGGYTLAYQRCCRNESILNIFDPGETGSTYTTSIPSSAWTSCNSSPRFDQMPPIILCANDPILFSSKAKDPDGDSLVYAFCDPHDGASTINPMPVPAATPPYGYVNFRPPFSAGSPISSDPALAIDPQSGLITGRPNRLGQYVMAVCVYEYRNGVLLGKNLRDFQFNVLNCTGSSTADFEAPGSVIENDQAPCKGLEVRLVNQSSNAASYLWDFGVPGTNTDRSTEINPSYVYADTGRYLITLYTNPGYSCGDTATLEVAVYHALNFAIEELAPLCLSNHGAVFRTVGNITGDAVYAWRFGEMAQPESSSLPNPGPIVWPDAGTYPVYLEISNSMCKGSDSTLVSIYPPLSVVFDIDKLSTCAPAFVRISDQSVVSPGATYLWDFGDGYTSTEASPEHLYTIPGTYTLSLRVNNNMACRDSFFREYPAYITVKPRPEAGLMADPPVTDIFNPIVRFTDLSSGASGTWLLPGDGNELFEADTLYTYADTGHYQAFLVAVNEQGCYDTARVNVRIRPVFSFYIPNAFTPNGDGINDTFGPRGEGFTDYSFSIFTSWGEKIYATTDPLKDWDGRANMGNDFSPVDVYVYHIRLRDADLQLRTFTGKVLLLH